MALTWDFKQKVGEITFRQTIDGKTTDFVSNLYVGNAYLIMVYEYEENGNDMYSCSGFFCDKQHMNRCLGLDKKYSTYGKNLYNSEYEKVVKIRLNKAKCKHAKEIVDAFIKAFDEITIEIYTEE